MKKGLFIFSVLFIAFRTLAFAQCTPDFTIDEPGLSPDDSDLDCIVQGEAYDATIQFKNFEEFEFGGNTVNVNSIRIDSINNGPSGIEWETNKSDNTFASGENGCIRVFGTTNDPMAIYPLSIIVTADIDGVGVIQVDAASQGLGYSLRVKEPGAECPEIETGVREISSVVSFELSPNPVKANANITFNSNETASFDVEVFTLGGQLVNTQKMEVVNGFNNLSLDMSTLSNGVYIISLRDKNNNRITERMVIAN
jgi:hypothetical protein